MSGKVIELFLKEFLQEEALGKLQEKLNEINLFELAGLVKQEIKHSHFLSILLDPTSKLNLGNVVLKEFIRDIYKANEPSECCTLSLFDFELCSHSDIEIRREYKNIDLLIANHSANENDRYCICIENKVEASESNHQLRKYREIVEKEFPSHKKLFIYLSPNNAEPIYDNGWLVGSYKSIVSGLNKINQSHITQEAEIIIRHYRKLLERHILNESELQALSQKIYRKHKAAIDYIFENKQDCVSEMSGICAEWLDKKSLKLDIKLLKTSKAYLFFATPNMLEVNKRLVKSDESNNFGLYMEVVIKNNSIWFKSMLGKTDNKTFRESFLEYLQNHLHVKSTSQSFSTIQSYKLHGKPLDECEDIESLFEEIKVKLEEFIKIESAKLNKVLNSFMSNY